MLYFVYGENRDASLVHKRELLQAFRRKRPGAHEVRLEGEEVTIDRLLELAGARGLFESKSIVVLDGSCESAVGREALVAIAPELAGSENAFIVFERDTVDASTEKALVAAAAKTFRCSAPVGKGVELKNARQNAYDPALFALADALGERDRKELWVRYTRARLVEGKAPEEIHGILFWQARVILCAHRTQSAEEAGLKPFVFSKSKRFAARYSREELYALAEGLVSLYHDARRGIHGLDTALERFILSAV